MNEAEAHELWDIVTARNFNKDGYATEWHPLALNAMQTMEADTLELGFRAAYYVYDENVWGEGALSNFTQGYDSLG